ncbi:MAG: hypothetical protein JWL97_2911 [Gemmatimonadales bacterium]|nr:hypothetical protein [Gemmatimonadales bacterium]
MKLMIIGVTLAGFAAFTPLNAQRPSGNQRTTRQNCTNTQSGSVTDVILGRRSASTVGCVDNRTNQRVNRTNQQVNGGGWYQVGNDGYGTIYERQVQDQYGNVVVQRARRDRNGNMSIISTRNVGNNGTYNNGGYNNGSYNNGTYNNRRRGDGDGDRDDQGNYQNRRHDNGNHYGQYKNGKGHGKNKDKGNKHGDD